MGSLFTQRTHPKTGGVHIKTKKILLIFPLAFIFFYLVIALSSYNEPLFEDTELGLIVWSSFDLATTKSISGIKTYRSGTFYTYDYLNSNEYVGLSFPYQCNGLMYYTTQRKDTNEDCIITKTKNEINFILSKSGSITYKKVYGNKLYYMLDNQIRGMDLVTGNDIAIIDSVNAASGFDINGRGELLYTSILYNTVILLDLNNMTSLKICDGRTARFINDDNIVFSSANAICSMNIDNKKPATIIKGVNCAYILLNPEKTHIVYIDIPSAKDSSYTLTIDRLHIATLNGKNDKEIECYPHYTYGIEWINYKTQYYNENTHELLF